MNVVKLPTDRKPRKHFRRLMSIGVCVSPEFLGHLQESARNNGRTVSQEIRFRLIRDRNAEMKKK